jgi:hypothetical protein
MSQARTRIAIGKPRESGGHARVAVRRSMPPRGGIPSTASRSRNRPTRAGRGQHAWRRRKPRRAGSSVRSRRRWTRWWRPRCTPACNAVAPARRWLRLPRGQPAQAKAVRTIEQRENRLHRHIEPVLGDVPVARWRLAHSRQVIKDAKARGVKSVGRLADIRQDLAAMRKLAWREGWLPRDVDPLDGLSLHPTVAGHLRSRPRALHPRPGSRRPARRALRPVPGARHARTHDGRRHPRRGVRRSECASGLPASPQADAAGLARYDYADQVDTSAQQLGVFFDHLRQVGIRGLVAEQLGDTDYLPSPVAGRRKAPRKP